MAAHSLHFDLPEDKQPGIWPWLIALLSGAALILSLFQTAQSIQSDIQQQANQVVADFEEYTGIESSVDGRDITIKGNIPLQQSIAPLLTGLAAIPGVRTVSDELLRFDPHAAKRRQDEQFLTRLATIDLSSIAFEPGSMSFTQGSQQALDQLVQLLIQNPDKRIRIEGHTDNTGRAVVNLRLSRERADAVALYLENRQVSSRQLIVKGYGSSQPIADNNTEAGRSRNRRIEVSYVD